MLEFFKRTRPSRGLTVAVNRRPVHGSWGGGNQWLHQMIRFLETQGCSVCFDLSQCVDCILMMDSRLGPPASFNFQEIKEYKRRSPKTACIHRINENDLHRGSDSWDKLLAQANGVADFTVFISQWLRNYHAERWFNPSRPHAVVLNGADPKVFQPAKGAQWKPGESLKLVTHHWSQNWNKGFSVYQEIDRLLTKGKLPGVEFWIIGRWPSEIRWRKARAFPPRQGPALARLLRSCHVYLTAALWEPGGMHMMEGLQCGLPLIYHREGGGIVEVGRSFGIGFREDVSSAVGQMRSRYTEFRQTLLAALPSGDRMCREYWKLIEEVLSSWKEKAFALR